MRFSAAAIVAFLSRHVVLRPGDLIASGTPARLATPPGPDRRLRPGDVVVSRIDGIGELTTTIADDAQGGSR
jgi:2-keto-4-pentenoate hydratase/2-oxohepta-3-ene-1,7-dioic acid hydratase in catechol pathway